MKPRGAVRGFLLLPRRRRGSRSRSIAPRAVRRRRGSRSPRDARNAPGRRAGAGRRARAPRPRAPRRGIKARADRESASIARGGGSGRVPRATPRSFSPGNHLLLAHSLHRDGALDCGRRTVRGEGRVSDRRASGGRRGARGRARVQGLSPRGRIPDAIEIDVFFRASAVRARAGTHREARTCGRCSCARPPWRGRRRRSWRRRWRPFSLGGVAVGGAERCVCEYARARAGRPGSATWNERRAFAAFHWTTHIETRIGPIAWGARVRTLGGRVT